MTAVSPGHALVSSLSMALCLLARLNLIINTFPGEVVAHIFDPSTQEAEEGVQVQPGLQSKFHDSQSYTEKPCLEKQ